MHLNGIHHITAITAEAQTNVDFYAGLLGLRFVKKTVNFDAPDVYHLYYADKTGSPGTVLTFFEFPGAVRGEAGEGMVHRIDWRVRGDEALDFWAQRLEGAGVPAEREVNSLRFADPEGLGLALVAYQGDEAPLAWSVPDIPDEHAIVGFEGVRAFARAPGASEAALTEVLGFRSSGESAYRAVGDSRSSTYAYDLPAGRGVQGAGTVHHIAWASTMNDHDAWRQRVSDGGLHVTPVIDRQYFRSIYFREPSGVLFEIATMGPGFDIDEPVESLGEGLMLPPQHEHLRSTLERTLTPLEVPRVTTR